MNSQIQQIDKANHFAAFRVQQSCHLNPWSESVFLDSLTKPYFAYQLVVDEQVIGYYIGLNVAGEATLMDLGVSGDYRGKGLGQQLLSHFILQCKLRNCDEIWLEVRESNQTAVQLYSKNDFSFIEIRKDYYPTKTGRENGLIMKTTLVK